MNDTSPDVESNEYNVCPFKLQWTIGMNVEVDLVNLTTRNRNLIAYACSHVVILYDYVTKDMTSLQGHKNAVCSLSASRDGKWLLSADHDEDSVCIVWDTETCVPICSLFNPHEKSILAVAQLSPDARYIVTVGNEESQILKLWLWTYGKDEPDATAELHETITERVKKISFNDDWPDEFVLTLNHSVIFVTWNNAKALEIHRPKIAQKNHRVTGGFNDSCYLSKTYQAMTVTSNGFVLIWDVTVHNERRENLVRSSNKKRFVKSVPLQKKNLTRIVNHKEIIVIGNNSGQLYFYDNQLRLLYWCKYCSLDSIVSISFDRKSNLERPEIPSSESTIAESEITEGTESLDDNTEDEEISESSTPKDREKTEIEENNSRIKNSREIVLESINEEIVNSKKNQDSTTQICDKDSLMKTTKNFTSSSITIDIDYMATNSRGKFREPTDCTLRSATFVLPNFFVSTGSGKIARLDLTSLKCRFIMRPTEGPITAIATRPKSDYVVTGNALGVLSLYKYTTRSRMVTKKTPTVPNLTKLLNSEDGKLDTTYVTCPQIHETLVGVSTLRFSPAKDGMLACGLKSGLIWILHPDTLEPIDKNPYKHSSSSIIDIIFTDNGEYFAYSDDLFTVGVYKKTIPTSDDKNLWNFLGKYHSHCSPIREILFLKPAVGKVSPRFLSLGEDQNLVEYDLENSGPYPEPGLKILHIDEIERHSVPLCMTVYPEFGVETFLITANSEHKFRLINDITKTIRITILGPTIGDPVQRILLPNGIQTKRKNRGYMIFATTKEIGLLVLPFDGNPYRIVAMIGHPKKISSMILSDCGKYLFTLGENDRGVFMWKVNYRSVDTMERLGGEGLTPFYSLIDGGREGWLVNEMKDLFYYAQVLQHGENTIGTRIVNERVSILQLPNLMRAVGFYPTNNQLETMMEEVSYGNYAETGQLVEEISFRDFVKLYVNHRPAFGITRNQAREAFRVFAKSDDLENPKLTSKQFLDVLLGRGRYLHDGYSPGGKLYGEPLSIEEAHAYLRRLVPQDEDSTSYTDSRDDKDPKAELNFEFLPPNISWKSFIDEILGIENFEISKSDADNAESSSAEENKRKIIARV